MIEGGKIMGETISLPVVLQNDFITSLRNAYPLCILYNGVHFKNWFYSKCILPVATIWKDASSDYELIDFCVYDKTYLPEILNQGFKVKYYQQLFSLSFSVFVSELRNSISNGTYWIVFVNEYYIGISNLYKKKHYMHEYLVYGIDSSRKNALVIGFNKHGHLDNLLIPLNELYNGVIFFDASNRKDFPIKNVQLIALSNRNVLEKNSVDLVELSNGINQYVLSNYPSELIRYSKLFYDGMIFYGMDTYDVIFYHIRNICKGGEKYNFRLIHCFYEHKKGIRDRIVYIRGIVSIDNLIQEYEKNVLQMAKIIRLKYLKTITYNKNFLEEELIKRYLESMRKNEIKILSKINHLINLIL